MGTTFLTLIAPKDDDVPEGHWVRQRTGFRRNPAGSLSLIRLSRARYRPFSSPIELTNFPRYCPAHSRVGFYRY